MAEQHSLIPSASIVIHSIIMAICGLKGSGVSLIRWPRGGLICWPNRRWLLVLSHLLDFLVACATGSILLSLFFAPLLDLRIVDSPFLFFLFLVRIPFCWASISPHFAKKPRDVRIGHVRIISLYTRPPLLRILQERRHGPFGRERVFLFTTLLG